MKKHLEKFASMLVLCILFAMVIPATQTAFAATKTFEYADQETGKIVTALQMELGGKADLKFSGVSNWKTYTYKWISSNEKVAKVDSNGLITAVGNGTATIELLISGGDGTQYTSTGVLVTVGKIQKITIGTVTESEIEYATVKTGEVLIMKAYGVPDGYECTWSSTNEHIAVVSNGIIMPLKAGLTVVQLTATNLINGEKISAVPIALQVTDEKTAAATTTPQVPTIEDNYLKLKNYIIKNGSTNSDGNKFVKVTNNGQKSGIVYDQDEDKLGVSFYMLLNGMEVACSFPLNYGKDNTVLVETLLRDEEKEVVFYVPSYIDISTYQEKDALQHGTIRSDGFNGFYTSELKENLFTIADTCTYLVLRDLNSALKGSVGISLKDLGFSAYE